MARRGRNPSPVRSGTDGSVPAKSIATDDAEETSSPGGLLPAVVQQQIDRELSQLEPQTRSRVQRLVVQVAHEVAEFSGPLPPPYYLREYEATAPGAPDRIISMAEQEQQHRHAWERSALSNTTVGLSRSRTAALTASMRRCMPAINASPSAGRPAACETLRIPS